MFRNIRCVSKRTLACTPLQVKQYEKEQLFDRAICMYGLWRYQCENRQHNTLMPSSVHQGRQESKCSKPVGSLIHNLLHYHIELCCLFLHVIQYMLFSPILPRLHIILYVIFVFSLNSRKRCNAYYTTYCTTYYTICTMLYTLLRTVLYARLYTTKKYTLLYSALQNNAMLYQCHV